MRHLLIVLSMLFCSATSAVAQVSIGIGLPGVSIGINLPLFPELVRVPGYPVYYAPQLDSNFFFYDGLYWVYENDNWYASGWYNGPWSIVGPESVPLFVLRIPVHYYRNPPAYFRAWRSDAPPRWGQHWGRDWERQRSGWDRWNRGSTPPHAPLPVYQRNYSGDRYPQGEQQQAIRNQHYRYQPRDAVVRQHDQAVQRAPSLAPQEQPGTVQERRGRERQEGPRAMPPIQQRAPADPRSTQQPGREESSRSAPAQTAPRQREPAVQESMPRPRQESDRHERQAPAANPEGNQRGMSAPQERRREQGSGQGRDKGEERDRGEERGQGRGGERNR